VIFLFKILLSEYFLTLAMKNNPSLPDPNAKCELEIARRRARHHCHDSARILAEVTHLVPFEDRAAYTKIAGDLSTIEQRLIDLAPKGYRQ
jgi:hypothetical protein